MKTSKKTVKLTEEEAKLLKAIKKEAKAEIKAEGEYSGYMNPKNHPDNALTAQQKKIFAEEKKILTSLVKKKMLEVVADDRRVTGYNLCEDEE